MTCVAGLVDRGRIYIGADSAGSNTLGQIATRRDPKVFETGPVVIGICGSFRMRDILQYHLHLPKYNPRVYTPIQYVVHEIVEHARERFKVHGFSKIENNQEEFDGSFIVGFKRKLFVVECDFQTSETNKPYVAIGSGMDIAHGSLYATQQLKLPPSTRLNLALEAAAEFNNGVRGPFYIHYQSEGKKK